MPRRPKPTALKILHGDEARTINYDEPQPSVGLPPPPDTLNEASRAVWDYIVAELEVLNLAKRPDRYQLAAYCEAVRIHAQAVKATQMAGILMKDPKHNTVKLNPAIRAQTASAHTMLAFAREFGLTPASRVQFRAEEIADDYAERLLS